MPVTSGAIKSRAFRALHGDDGELLGGRGQEDLQLRPFGLEVVLHMGEHARRAACCRRDMEAVGRQPGDDAVVEDVAILLQHQPVAAAAGFELQPTIDVDAVHELGRIGADDLDLAQRAGVEDADMLAHRRAFARHRLAHVLIAAWKIPGALPEPDILEPRALFLGPAMDRRLARGVEKGAARWADQRAEGDGRIGRPEGGRADCRQGLVQNAGDDAERVHVRALALVCRHARGGVNA